MCKLKADNGKVVMKSRHLLLEASGEIKILSTILYFSSVHYNIPPTAMRI